VLFALAKRMRAFLKALSTTVVVLLAAAEAVAQTATEPPGNTGAAIGIALQRLQDDFGISASWTSPAFFQGKVRITADGGVAWFPHALTASGEEEWVPFGHSHVVVESGQRVGRAPLRLYGFGGAMLIFRPDRLSNDVTAMAGIGGFGFEFFVSTDTRDSPVSYFIEVGGVGSGARADNLLTKPFLLNGFLIRSGVRFYP
jgi:hypothetical protein